MSTVLDLVAEEALKEFTTVVVGAATVYAGVKARQALARVSVLRRWMLRRDALKKMPRPRKGLQSSKGSRSNVPRQRVARILRQRKGKRIR